MGGGKGNIKPEDGKPFTSLYQPKRKRGPTLFTKIKKSIFSKNEYLTLTNVEQLDQDNIPTGNRVNVRVQLLKADAIVLHYMQRVKKNDRLLQDLLDRTDGKPQQHIELSKAETMRIGYGPDPDEEE